MENKSGYSVLIVYCSTVALPYLYLPSMVRLRILQVNCYQVVLVPLPVPVELSIPVLVVCRPHCSFSLYFFQNSILNCFGMRFAGRSTLLLSLFLTASYAHDAAVCVTDAASPIAPMVPALLMKNGNVIEASDDDNGNVLNVMGCCGTCADDSSLYTPQIIGQMPQMTEKQAMDVLEAAKEAWNGGSGVWPQMSLGERITAIENFLVELRSSRDAIIEILMWEIGKNKPDATAEFDRTVQFIETMITEVQTDPEFNSDWQTIGATRAFVRRTAIGIIMCLGPYNYPLNETWAMAFAALLAGNVLVLKIPTVGGLCHLLTST